MKQWDLNDFKIFVNNKKVYDKTMRISNVENANKLLKLLFKIVHIEIFDKGQSIFITPKSKWSCLIWNIIGKNYFIKSNGIELRGSFYIEDITKKHFTLFKTRNEKE